MAPRFGYNSSMIDTNIFRQYDIRGVVGQDLTVEAAEAIGRAYGALLTERGIPLEVAVGRCHHAHIYGH